jgi:hypothetical protein
LLLIHGRHNLFRNPFRFDILSLRSCKIAGKGGDMTIKFESLAPLDQQTVTTVWAELMRTLDKPANLQQNINTWFGTACPAQFRTALPRVLRRFRSCMNLCVITLCCCDLDDRDIDTFGAAYHNTAGGFLPIINFDPSTQPKLRLELDSKWNTGIDLYKTPTDRDSAFQTIAHELSHLLMATKDEPWQPPQAKPKCYGEQKCLSLATGNDVRALTNADNWGYFMEDCRG